MIKRRVKKNICCLLLAASCLLTACLAFCQESELALVYDSQKKRDPFIPLITDKTVISTGLIGVETIEDIVLEGIVWDPEGDSLVILNGMIVKENELINNIKVIEVRPKWIKLKINEEVFTKELIEEEGE